MMQDAVRASSGWELDTACSMRRDFFILGKGGEVRKGRRKTKKVIKGLRKTRER